MPLLPFLDLLAAPGHRAIEVMKGKILAAVDGIAGRLEEPAIFVEMTTAGTAAA